MPSNIIRWNYPSIQYCLPAAAACAMGSQLPTWYENGQFVSQLRPEHVVRDWESYTGAPIPSTGIADGSPFWEFCRQAYSMGVWPRTEAQWSWDMAKKWCTEGVPLLVPLSSSYTWDGHPMSTHIVTVFDMAPDELVYWDTNDVHRKDIVMSKEDFYIRRVYRDGQWLKYPRWNGWWIGFGDPQWGDPEFW